MTSFFLPQERHSEILRRLRQDGRVIATDLARDFDTSEDTVRRDLRDLAAAGSCRRVYGGALPLSPASGTLAQRERQNRFGKQALGRAAATLVRSGQMIFIDAGSTNLCVAEALPDDMTLTVATNAPSVALALESKPAVSIVLIGGRLERPTGGTLGSRAVRDAQGLRPDLYFVGTCAVDPLAGITVFDSEEAELKRTLVAASRAVAAVATDEKLGTLAPFLVIHWADLDHLVVESETSFTCRGLVPESGPATTCADRLKDRP